MRYESTITSLSWIPSEAATGLLKMPFETGFLHYDAPPPDRIDDLEDLRQHDRFRFANELRAWIEVEDGRITKYGYAGGGHMGSTTVKMGPKAATFQGFSMPDIQHDPEVGDGGVTFVQTTGGRTGVPAPRRVRRAPFIQWKAPLVWTTLALTIRADGTTSFEVRGASKFPRHWVFGDDGEVVAKVGLAEFKEWYRRSFGKHTPWGDEESPALVTAAESALERQLSTQLMHGGGKPRFRKLWAGETVVNEGDEGDDVFLVLDGVVRAEKGGERLAEYGPGAVLGERSGLEGGRRTCTLTAVTKGKIALVPRDALAADDLVTLSLGHRHEEA